MLNKFIHSMKKENGFSLIEMLVALVILSTGLIAIAGLQTKMLTEGGLSKDKSIAEYYAKQKMEELRRLGCGINCINLPIDPSPLPNPNPRSDTISSYSSEFTRTWSIASGSTENIRVVKILVSWLDQAGLTKSVELVSYISQFDQLDFANLTYPPGASSNPIATITDWKPNNYWGKEVIVKYKTPQGETKYYMSNLPHQDAPSLNDPSSSSDWVLVQFVEGTFTWTPNNMSTHTVCELRFGNFSFNTPRPVAYTDDEITAFVIKNNGSPDPTAINTAITARRCSPNMLSGIGILSTKYACVVKAGESKKIYTQCEIEDGAGGTSTVGPLGPFTGTQTGVNISLCQSNGVSCSSGLITPTPVVNPTATPVVTVTPLPTTTPVVTPTPTVTVTPILISTISVTVNMGTATDGSACELGTVVNATCNAATGWNTGALTGQGIQSRSYSTTCTVIDSNITASVPVRCGNSGAKVTGKNTPPPITWQQYQIKTISPANTTTYTFDNM